MNFRVDIAGCRDKTVEVTGGKCIEIIWNLSGHRGLCRHSWCRDSEGSRLRGLSVSLVVLYAFLLDQLVLIQIRNITPKAWFYVLKSPDLKHLTEAFDDDDMAKVTQYNIIDHVKLKYDTNVHGRLVEKDLPTDTVFVHKTCRKSIIITRPTL